MLAYYSFNKGRPLNYFNSKPAYSHSRITYIYIISITCLHFFFKKNIPSKHFYEDLAYFFFNKDTPSNICN